MRSSRNTKLLMHEVLSYFPVSERTHFRSICSDYEDISNVASNLSAYLSTILIYKDIPLASYILLKAYRSSFPVNSAFPTMSDYSLKPIKFKKTIFDTLKIIGNYKVTGRLIADGTQSEWQPENQSILDWYSVIHPSTLEALNQEVSEINSDVHIAISLLIFDSLDFLHMEA